MLQPSSSRRYTSADLKPNKACRARMLHRNRVRVSCSLARGRTRRIFWGLRKARVPSLNQRPLPPILQVRKQAMSEKPAPYRLADGRVVSVNFKRPPELKPDPAPYKVTYSSHREPSKAKVVPMSPEESGRFESESSGQESSE